MTNLLKKESVLAPQSWFAASILFLCAAIFLGNKCIGIGHGFAGVGLLLLLSKGSREALLWKRLRPSSWFLIAFAFAVLLSILANWSSISHPLSYAKKIRYEVLIFLFLLLPVVRFRVFESQRFRDLCLWIWLISFAATTILGMVVFFLGKPLPFMEGVGHVGRASGIYGQVMTFAYSLQFTVLALTALVIRKPLFEKLSGLHWAALFPFFLLSGFGLYFSYSRGAVISVGLSLFVFAVMQSKWLLLGVIALGLAVGTYAYNDKWAYTDQPLYFKAEDPVRVNQWRTAGLAFLENPVFGLGFRQFEQQSVALKERYEIAPAYDVSVDGKIEKHYFRGHAHNNYLEAFASTGILGGITFLGFCFCWLRESWRGGKLAPILVSLVVAFLFSGFFENTFNDSEVLNAILLLYFFSQLLLDWQEKERSEKVLSSG